MNKLLRNIFILCIISGVFFGLSFPPVNFHILVFFAFAILIHVIISSGKLFKAVLRTYLLFFIFGLISISWISLSGMLENADGFLILGGAIVLVVNPIFFIIPSLIFFMIYKFTVPSGYNNISLFSFPFIWTGFEYLFTLSQASFPWLLLGNSQTYNLSKLQYIDITGVFGVSFWICLTGVLIYMMYEKIKSESWNFKSRNTIILVITILIIYFLPDIYSSITSKENKYSGTASDEKLKVGIIQPNINPWLKWGSNQNTLIQGYVEQIHELYNEHPDVQLIVMPETALPYYFREPYFEDKFTLIKETIDSIDVPMLIGTPDLLIYEDPLLAPVDAKIYKSSGQKYDTYNTAVLILKNRGIDQYQTYHKMKLVAGSERMPYQEYLPFIQDLIRWGVGISSWQIGRDTTIFEIEDKFKFNAAICYESIYPEFFSGFVKKGAEFSVIITNDGWWGKLFGTYQHNQYAVLRAVENRRWIVRSANTGVSCFIDPYGNILDATEVNEKAAIIREVGIREEKTFYTENGDLFARINLITAGIMLIASLVVWRKKN
jgi:apolipoprotein N-acyltransferase